MHIYYLETFKRFVIALLFFFCNGVKLSLNERTFYYLISLFPQNLINIYRTTVKALFIFSLTPAPVFPAFLLWYQDSQQTSRTRHSGLWYSVRLIKLNKHKLLAGTMRKIPCSKNLHSRNKGRMMWKPKQTLGRSGKICLFNELRLC